MMTKRLKPCAVMISLLTFTFACKATPTPAPPTPLPPAHLRDLPQWARLECPEEEAYRVGVYLWEHAAWPPREESSTMGEPGAQLGLIESCAAVEVLQFEWSAFDEAFWVLVDNHNGQRGWLAAKYIEFEP